MVQDNCAHVLTAAGRFAEHVLADDTRSPKLSPCAVVRSSTRSVVLAGAFCHNAEETDLQAMDVLQEHSSRMTANNLPLAERGHSR